MATVSAGSDLLPMIASLEHPYEIENPIKVEAFLRDHPQVLALLLEASARIPQALPTSGPILIEVEPDREEGEMDGDLFAIVPTDSAPEEALARMADFRREWLIEAVRRARGRFNIVLRYV